MDELCCYTSSYLEEEARLQTVFPEEIWVIILSRITDADSYQSCCTASSYFYKLMFPHRTKHLFSDVIKHLTNYSFLSPQAHHEYLQCRLVCRTWKLGVDTEFHNILNHCVSNSCDWISPSNPPCAINRNKAFVPCSFSSENQIERFLRVSNNSHFLTGKNPFPSRAIKISICLPLVTEITYAYLQKLVKLLKIYGHHIWHCFLTIDYRISDVKPFSSYFCSVLESLPQLRTLRIHHAKNLFVDSGVLENILRENPLPKLEKLEFLEQSKLARSIFASMIKSNPHITKLIIHDLNWNYWNTNLQVLTKLEELHILYFRSWETFRDLQNLQATWPLKSLHCFVLLKFQMWKVYSPLWKLDGRKHLQI